MKFLLLFCILLSPVFSSAEFDSVGIAINKLKAYKLKDLKLDLDGNEGSTLMIDQMFDDLREATATAMTSGPLSPELIHELARVSLITFKHDPMAYAAELILPVYKKDRKLFEKSLGKFPKSDSELLLQSVRDAEREIKQGNG